MIIPHKLINYGLLHHVQLQWVSVPTKCNLRTCTGSECPQTLQVDCFPTSLPKHSLLPHTPNHALQDGFREEYTISQFCWGPGDADLKYFQFVNPYTKQLCYWVVEGGDIVVRTQEEVSKSKHDVHVFFTEVVEDCSY